jgi:pilus assembly protein Flp/PilA
MPLSSCDSWEGRMVRLSNFFRDESGATAIEYALIAGSISIVILVAVQGIGTKLNSTFTQVENGFQ